MTPPGLVLSEVWLLGPPARGLVLTRPGRAQRLEVPGRAGAIVARALSRARAGVSAQQWAELLRPLGAAGAREVQGLVAAHGLLRELTPHRRPRVRGGGPLLAPLRALLARGGWDVPPLRLSAHAAARSGGAGPGSEVSVLCTGEHLLAALSRGRPCLLCGALRFFARQGTPGEDQTGRLKASTSLSPRTLGALAAELLLELSIAPPRAGEGLCVAQGSGAARGQFLPHEDCPACGVRPRPRARASQALRRALSRDKARAPVKGAREALLDPLFGPVELDALEGARGGFPFPGPFIWGSVHLSRWLEGRALCTSTRGGIYSNTPSAARSRLLALSEGLERLAARGARADLVVSPAREPDAVPLRSLYASCGEAAARRRRPHCVAVDLTTGRERLLPYESVVVGLPEPLYPEAAHRQPFYSGAASHQTLLQAALHATVELVKRDAFLITWYRRRALAPLAWPQRPSAAVQARADFLTRRHLSLELFELTAELPLPMVLLRVTARRTVGNFPRGGALLVPSGGFGAMEALEHALGLACGQVTSLTTLAHPSKDPLDVRAVRALARTSRFWPLMARYLDGRNAGAHAFLRRGSGRAARAFEAVAAVPARTPRAQLEWLRARFQALTQPWLLVRLTTETAERAGLEEGKVVLPGYLHLAPSRGEVDLGLPRLHRPWPDATLRGLNPDPHPLY